MTHAPEPLARRELAEAVAFFVQFPHPGAENVPAGDEAPWNASKHRRKFLIAPGRYIDAGGSIKEAELTFWGEWEPPSRVEHRWPSDGRHPRVLHRPYWVQPTTKRFRLNTDPWVFGDQMVYSNCKQLGPKRGPTQMQSLTRGSVICFGSTIDCEFCVDTVFVVDSSMKWVPRHTRSLPVGDAFITCTAHASATSPRVADAELTLYLGATVDSPVEGMFSFVPAKPANVDAPRFPRPPVVSEFINPSCRQSPRGSRQPLSMVVVRNNWQSIRDQILDAGLVLGVSLETPVCKKVGEQLRSSRRQRC